MKTNHPLPPFADELTFKSPSKANVPFITPSSCVMDPTQNAVSPLGVVMVSSPALELVASNTTLLNSVVAEISMV